MNETTTLVAWVSRIGSVALLSTALVGFAVFTLMSFGILGSEALAQFAAQ